MFIYSRERDDAKKTDVELYLLRHIAFTAIICFFKVMAINQLTELNLSNVPELVKLWCGTNQLTELNLSNVPALTTLECHNNQLTELDIRLTPLLNNHLRVDDNIKIIR